MKPPHPAPGPPPTPEPAGHVAHRAERLLKFAWALLIVGAFVVALDYMVAPPGRDSSTFIYVAEGILAGELPYADRWDHKGPLIYLLNAAALAVAGVPGIWLLNAIFLVVSGWLVFKLAANNFGRTAALPALVLFLAYFAGFNRGGNLTEGYSILFQLLALVLFTSTRLEQDETRRTVLAALAIGMLSAMAFLLRANLIGVWLAIGVLWAVQGRPALKPIAWSSVGGVSILSAASALLIATGSWGAMWDAYIAYNFAYVDASLTSRIKAFIVLANSLNILTPLLALGWLIGFYHLATGRARRLQFYNALAVAVILGPVEVALIVMSGFSWGHYYLAILPVAVVLIAFLAWLLIRELKARPRAVSAAILVALTFTSLFAGVAPNRVFKMADKYMNPSEILTTARQDLVVSLIREQSHADDRILVWGAESWIYTHSERHAPTRFFYQYPLVKPGYSNAASRGEFMADVIRHRPTIIVDTGNHRLAPLDPLERSTWQPTDSRYVHDPSDFKPFFDFVDAEYKPFEEVEGFTLYRLRER